MRVESLKMYYGQGINIDNYQDNQSQVVDVPHCLEQVFTECIKYPEVFYTIDLTAGYRGKLIKFNGVSYRTKLYIDKVQVAVHQGIWDCFNYQVKDSDISKQLVIRVERYNFDPSSDDHFRKLLIGFVPDVAMPFSGIYQTIEVVDNRLELGVDYKTYKNKLITDEYDIEVSVEGCDYHQDGNETTLVDVEYWCPNNPKLYSVTFKQNGNQVVEQVAFIDFKTEDNIVYLSDSKFYMKGILHWGYYPEIIRPVLDYEAAETEILKIKAAGFNTIKLCLFIAPDYYYQLCLKHGIVIWQEFPLWLPPASQVVNERIKAEFPLYIDKLKKYANITHLSIGCELEGTVDQTLLDQMYKLVKSEFPTKLVCDNSGSNECFTGVSNLTSDFYDYHFYGELDNFSSLVDIFTADYRGDKPWYFGEFADADTWRDVSNYEGEWWTLADEERNLLHKVHKGFNSGTDLTDQARLTSKLKLNHHQLTASSTEQAFAFRKAIIEKLRLKPMISGYNITTLRDVAITTAGIFNDQMELKFPQISDLLADQNTVLIPPLRRKWIAGGDIYKRQDMINVTAGQPFEAKLLYSNLVNAELTSIITVELNGEQIKRYEVNSSKFISEVADLNISQLQLGVNELVITTTNSEDTATNEHQLIVTEAAKAPIVITADLNYCDNNNPVLYVVTADCEQYSVTPGPLDREAIIYSPSDKFADRFGAIDKVSFQNVAPKCYCDQDDITKLSLISRIDARKFTSGSYLWRDGDNYYTTFDLLDEGKAKEVYRDKAAITNRLICSIWEDYYDRRND